jgi:predicted outer membrane repeat protein
MRVRTLLGATVAVALAAVVIPSTAQASSIVYVGPATVGGGSCASPNANDITAGVALAVAGDTVHVCAGIYPQTSTVTIDKNLILQGDGAEVSVITGSNKTVRIFDVVAPATTITVNDLSLTDGMAGLVSGAPTENGGAIRAAGAGMSVTANGVYFDSNKAVAGGAIYVDGDVSITGGRMTYNGNSSTLYGGAIYSRDGHAVLDGVQIGYNKATASGGAGGAVQADWITIQDSQVGYNEANEHGGALSAGTVDIVRTGFSNNSSGQFAGAAWATTMTVSQSGFIANTAAGGGALAATADIVISQSGFGTNSASLYGGAVYSTGASVHATNSTFSGNVASGAGGAVMAGTEITLTNDTFTGNSSPVGSSVLTTDFTTTGSIFADEGGWGCQVTRSLTPGIAGNLTLDATCTGQLTTLVDLALQPAADNGGPTPTIALGEKSVALDFDTDCADTLDQRGFARPYGLACDSGAYEWQPMPVITLPPPWLLAFGRAAASETCPDGTSPSWAQWPNDGTGGYTCESSVVYDPSTAKWVHKTGFA